MSSQNEFDRNGTRGSVDKIGEAEVVSVVYKINLTTYLFTAILESMYCACAGLARRRPGRRARGHLQGQAVGSPKALPQCSQLVGPGCTPSRATFQRIELGTWNLDNYVPPVHVRKECIKQIPRTA